MCLQEFHRASIFGEHLERIHSGLYSSVSQLKALITQGEHSVHYISPSECPLCDEFDISRQTINPELTNRSVSRFGKHLGKHLVKLALFALPRLDDADDDGEESIHTNDGTSDGESNINFLGHFEFSDVESNFNFLGDIEFPGTVLPPDLIPSVVDSGTELSTEGQTGKRCQPSRMKLIRPELETITSAM
jgi:hypothetical protein